MQGLIPVAGRFYMRQTSNNNKMRRVCFGFFLVIVITSFLNPVYGQDCPKREMRAAWVATVANIDWPSATDLSTEEQQVEFDALLKVIKDYNLNTIVFQIRPSADAMYKSSLEPWSRWLNGEQGKAPDPYYDPLEYAISKCRENGIDIHVWLNPYRAVSDTAHITSDDHVTRTHPEWFLTYGKTVYFNPGLQETRDFVASVVGDIVRRYDIDAIHMDDYFYPYRIAKVEFPDDSTFAAYPRGFAADKKNDWRRDNVDLIIEQLHDTIKAIKPWVEFGISPFGVWRNIANDPAGSKTRAGVTNYDDLYADILKWQQHGFIDYVTPQIYWEIGKEVADYAILADWWSRNTYGCQLFIGQAPYRISRKSKVREWKRAGEITDQISLNRTYPNIQGSMFFSTKSLVNNPRHLKEKLTRKLYRYPALVPENNNIDPVIPEAPLDPVITVSGSTVTLAWEKGYDTKSFVIYRLRKGKRADMDDPANIFCVTSEESLTFTVESSTDPARFYYVISSLSHTNHESMPEYFEERK